MSSAPSDRNESDPTLEARVEQAVAPYVGLLPPEDVEALRAMIRRVLATHPVVAPLVDRLRPRAVPLASGEAERRDPAALEAAARRLEALAAQAGRGRRGGAA